MSGAHQMTAVAPGKTIRWHPLALVPLALTAWVYYPITRVFFFADDLYHLGTLSNEGLLAFLVTPFGGHNYLVRNIVFIGSWQLFGLHSELWYWTVLLTHLLNVWLLFGVIRALTTSFSLACFGATLWGICPLSAGTIGWYSVFGHAMSGTILLLVLDRLTRIAASGEPLQPGTAWVWYVLLLAGTTCFGTGIGVALVFPAVLFLLLLGAWRQPSVRLAYLALPVVTLATYFGFKLLASWIAPQSLPDQVHQAAAAKGLWLAPAMVLPLLGFSAAGTALGHFFRPQHFPDTWTWLVLAVFAAGLGLVAWRGDWKERRAALAMAALAIGAYAVIAVGRAQVFSMFGTPFTRAAAEPRYHYVGTIPVVILICLVLGQLGRIGWLSAVPRSLLLAAGLGFAVAGDAGSNFRIDEHPATRAYVTRTIQEIADAVAAAPPGTTVYLENGSTNAVIGPWLEKFLPGRAGLFLLASPSADLLEGRHVRFIERNPKVLEYWAARPDTRLARLLVAPLPGDQGSAP